MMLDLWGFLLLVPPPIKSEPKIQKKTLGWMFFVRISRIDIGCAVMEVI